MIIYDACEKDNQIIINGITESNDKLEKDIFFCGEISGRVLNVELTNRILWDCNKFQLVISNEMFSEKKISDDCCLKLKSNFSNKNMLIHSVIEKMFHLEDKIYGYNIEITKEEIIIQIVKLKRTFFVEKYITDSYGTIFFEISEIMNNSECKCELWIERRLSEKLWKYKTEMYYISNIEKNGKVKFVLPSGLLYSMQKKSYFDFVVKCKEDDISANYFLYIRDNIIKKIDETNISDCNIKYHMYKSGGNNLAFWAQEKENVIFVNNIQHNNYNLTFTILNKTCDDDIRLYLKKRTFMDNGIMHDRTWEKKVKYDNNDDELRIYISDNELLKNNVHKADELWDAYLIIDGILYSMCAKEKQQTEYFANNDGYRVCMFSREDGGIAVYTHESDYQNNRKIKIAVLGTCFSRSVFKSAPYFNGDYKKYYDCVYTQFHSSIISLASEPVEDKFWKDEMKFLSKEQKLYLPTEFKKDFFGSSLGCVV